MSMIIFSKNFKMLNKADKLNGELLKLYILTKQLLIEISVYKWLTDHINK